MAKQDKANRPTIAETPPPKPRRQPEKKIGPFANGVGACIWLNSVETNEGTRQLRSITINPRRYFDQASNSWKDAPSFNPADLPALIFALTKAQEFCYEAPLPGQTAGESTGDDQLSGEGIPF